MADADPPTEPGERDAQRRRSRIWRALLRIFAAITVLALCLVGLLLRFFIWPVTDGLAPADAVVVLSGDHGERLPEARRLLARGLADTLVMVGTPDSQTQLDLCAGRLRVPYRVICPQPNPDSTRNEARAVGDLAREERWDRVIVVTSSFHVTRAGILFRRCVDADVRMRDARPWPYLWRSQVVREAGGVLQLLTVKLGC